MSLRPQASGRVDVSDATETSDRLGRVLLAGLAVEARTKTSMIARKKNRDESSKPYERPSAPPQPTAKEQPEGLPLAIPNDAEHQQDFDRLMFGKDTLNAILLLGEVGTYPYTVMRSGPYPNALSPLKGGLYNNEWRSWFQSKSSEAVTQEKPVGKGSFNTAYLIQLTDDDLKSRAALAYPRDQFTGGLPKKIVYRTSAKDVLPTAEEALAELIITGYAAVSKIGPQLIIGYIEKPFDEAMYYNIYLKTTVLLHCYSEAWTGDLNKPLSDSTIQPTEFAREFANLLESSSSAGFWHIDAKPHNMLYRRDANGRLKICWTDFDPKKCFIMSPTVRQAVGYCSVLAHAAQIMGFISCVMDEKIFNYYLPAVRQELETRFKISKISNGEMCNFITQMPSEWMRAVDPDSFEKGSVWKKTFIANELLLSLRWYVDDLHYSRSGRGGTGKRCMLQKDSDRGKLQQFFDFALLQVGEPEVEEWASFSSNKQGGQSYAIETTAKD